MELNSEEVKLEKLLREVKMPSPSEARIKKIFSEFDKNISAQNFDLMFFRIILASIVICFGALFWASNFVKGSIKINTFEVANSTYTEMNNTFNIIFKSIISIFTNFNTLGNYQLLIFLSFFIVYLILQEFEIITSEL